MAADVAAAFMANFPLEIPTLGMAETVHRCRWSCSYLWEGTGPPSMRRILGERSLHAQCRHEVGEIRADLRQRLAQQTGKQAHDRRIFTRCGRGRNAAALNLSICRTHADDSHAKSREHVVIGEILNRPAER